MMGSHLFSGRSRQRRAASCQPSPTAPRRVRRRGREACRQSHCLNPPVWDERAYFIGEFVWLDESDGFEERAGQESREFGWSICHVDEPSYLGRHGAVRYGLDSVSASAVVKITT